MEERDGSPIADLPTVEIAGPEAPNGRVAHQTEVATGMAHRLRAEAGRLAEGALAHVGSEISSEALDDGLRSGIFADLRDDVHLLADLVEGRAPDHLWASDDERGSVIKAEDGLPLIFLLSAHRRVLADALRFIVRGGHRPRPGREEVDTLVDVALGLLSILEDTTARLTATYIELHDRQLMTREQARRAVLDDLLAGAFLSEDDIHSRADEFGYDLRLPHAVLLLCAPGPNRRVPGERRKRSDPQIERPSISEQAATAFSVSVPRAAVVSQPTGAIPHVALVASCAAKRDWADLVRVATEVQAAHDVTVLAAAPVAGASNICQTYMEARDTLPLAMLVLRGPGVINVDDLLVYSVLLGHPKDHQRFLTHTFGPLLDLPAERRQPLVDTLQAYYDANGEMDTASESLHVHENTVRYRLRRIEELTGLSVRTPQGQIRIFFALHLLDLSAAGALHGDPG